MKRPRRGGGVGSRGPQPDPPWLDDSQTAAWDGLWVRGAFCCSDEVVIRRAGKRLPGSGLGDQLGGLVMRTRAVLTDHS